MSSRGGAVGRSTWALARDLVAAPDRAFERLERPGAALAESALLYLAFTIAFSLFYAWKPPDFPQAARAAFEAGGMPQGFWFWLGTGVLGAFMTALWVAMLGTILQFAPRAWQPLALALQLAWTTGTVVAVVLYKQTQVSQLALALMWAALLAPLAWVAKTRTIPWARLLSLMLALNVFAILSCAPMVVAVILRSENLYILSQAGVLLWMLLVGTRGIRRFTGFATPRVFLSLGFSMVGSVMALFTLYFMGLVSERMLKVYFVP